MSQNPGLEAIRSKQGFLCDMDGVLFQGDRLLEGVPEFVSWLERNQKQYLFLTNGSGRTPLELQQRLARMGLDVDVSKFYTSALATARFLQSQLPGCSAYIIGEPGLFNALHDMGIVMNEVNPDYVVVGETRNYNYDQIARAVHYVRGGAKLIGTNSDLTNPGEAGITPACRALIAPIELACERKAYFIGKPNALMMRTGLKLLGCRTSEAAMIGDRMDTDIVAGIETGIDTVLVLSGVTDEKRMRTFPYRPQYILNGVGEIAQCAEP
ncbi:MAG: HAD-IIA family hydrolase [Oscillospiraceae bacterium]|jgi:NagD protein|nr:HAD-IIA family hydrolase [Oscillospiraceae bacterium]